MVKTMVVKKSTKPDKKLMAIFDIDGKKKTTHFGNRGSDDYLKTKEGKIFFDFINIVEKDLPKIAGKIEDLRVERNLLREKGEDYSHIRKRYNDKDLLQRKIDVYYKK